MSDSSLKALVHESGLPLSDGQIGLLERFAGLLTDKNQVLNLTGRGNRDEILVKHIIDSLMIIHYLPIKRDMRVLDLGTGGGLPGIPLAIVLPGVRFTLVDSVAKKIRSVEEFVKALELQNVTTVIGRAEELGRQPEYREQFDLVLTRALAPFRILAELAYPFVHLNGKLVAYKGPDYLHELTEARQAIRFLDAEPPQVRQYALPLAMGSRALIIIAKKRQIPEKYPRRTGVPEKRPL